VLVSFLGGQGTCSAFLRKGRGAACLFSGRGRGVAPLFGDGQGLVLGFLEEELGRVSGDRWGHNMREGQRGRVRRLS